jgi:GT2 family glycosyltransferase
VVPSYGRPDVLRSCLAGLLEQHRMPDEVLAVHRADDQATLRVILATGNPVVTPVPVTEPGHLAALEAGARRSTGDVVAMTDDDAVPRPDWLARILEHFADPSVGGVGGRDAQPGRPPADPATRVGQIGPWGRVVGNHHVGSGPSRDVMVIKGANMAWRRTALAFPIGLRGRSTQMHTEIPMALWARSQGWRLVYDPAVVVDHYVAPRAERSRRLAPEDAYNLALGMTAAGYGAAYRRALYGFAVGDRGCPGAIRTLVAVARREHDVVRDLPASVRGQASAFLDLLRGRRITMKPLVVEKPR